MRKWHHACASWNGKTGEWQLWVKAERVGRGFHNRVCTSCFVFVIVKWMEQQSDALMDVVIFMRALCN